MSTSHDEIVAKLKNLFSLIAGKSDADLPEFVEDQNGLLLRSKYLHPEGIDRETFKSKLTWEKLTEVLGEEQMKKRFTDLDGDGNVDMDDVWLQLDTNADSHITIQEFVSECMGEPYFTPEDAEEVFGIYRDQEPDMPIDALGDALAALGLNPTEAEISELQSQYDTNADGKIDAKEWNAILKSMQRPEFKANRKLAREMFSIIAKGDDHVLSDEIAYVGKNLGLMLKDNEIKEMLTLLDGNQDGKINYEEFVPMLQKIVGP